MKEVRRLLRRDKKRLRRQHVIIRNAEKSFMPLVNIALISDIDNTLIGDRQALKQLNHWLKMHRGQLAFGIATGRSIESAVAILKKQQVDIPDILISSVGSEIHYGKKLIPTSAGRHTSVINGGAKCWPKRSANFQD